MSYVQPARRRGILCPRCGLHAVRTIQTCEQIARELDLNPDWWNVVERRTEGLLDPSEVTMEDLARGYVLEP